MPDLTPTQRSVLKALAHAIDPVVMIGEAGLSASVLNELERGLNSHGLIKVKVFSDERQARQALLTEICQRLEAAPVQHIGKMLIIYRPKPEEPAQAAASPARKRAPRRTKRSFQI